MVEGGYGGDEGGAGAGKVDGGDFVETAPEDWSWAAVIRGGGACMGARGFRRGVNHACECNHFWCGVVVWNMASCGGVGGLVCGGWLVMGCGWCGLGEQRG